LALGVEPLKYIIPEMTLKILLDRNGACHESVVAGKQPSVAIMWRWGF